MFPALLVFLTLAAESSSEVNPGLTFTVAFPENIAYYHPDAPQNKVRITAMKDNTQVSMKWPNNSPSPDTLSKGETRDYPINSRLELSGMAISSKTLVIESSDYVTVHAISSKKTSTQTALVLPTDQLGKEYFVPPVLKIQGTTVPEDIVTTLVTERAPFKLVIVNADKVNNVIVGNDEGITLQPHEVVQVWVQGESSRTVKADHAIAVLFGHTCAMKDNCVCGQLYATLPPARDQNLNYYIPPFLAQDAPDTALVLLSERGSTRMQAFNQSLQVVQASGSAFFYRPGLLLPLIPDSDFASCYVVNAIGSTESSALIVVHKNLTGGVRKGTALLQNPDWQELRGTDYVSTRVALSDKTVLWHASSVMAVYFVGKKANTLFGNPAHIVSKTPDFRGCVLSPEVVEVSNTTNGWRESIQYCRSRGLDLVSFPGERLQRQVYAKVLQAKKDVVQEVWIGMRRSSWSGKWYWLNQQPVNDTNWDEGEPGTMSEGQCAVMSLQRGRDFGWSDKDCCQPAYSVCYKPPVLFW